MSDGITSYQSKIQVNDGPGFSWQDILEVTDFESPEAEVADVKMSHLNSPNKTHEYRPGAIEPGMCKFKANTTRTQYIRLSILLGVKFLAPGVPILFRNVWPDGTLETFSGYIKARKNTVPELSDRMSLDCTIKVDGVSVVT